MAVSEGDQSQTTIASLRGRGDAKLHKLLYLQPNAKAMPILQETSTLHPGIFTWQDP